jgi:ferric-dicitrate binding protein FerR (iron transport regulator)
MVDQSFHALVNGYINNTLTKKELAYFLELLQKEEYHDEFQEAISRLLKDPSPAGKVHSSRADIIFQNIIRSGSNEEKFLNRKNINGKWTFIIPLIKVAVAASFIGLAVLGAHLWLHKGDQKAMAHHQTQKQRFKNDVLPGGDKAVLTLADGSTIVLDDAKDGALTQQGNAKIIKLGGKLSYNLVNNTSKEVAYNTISTPRGGQYQVELPDGTQVWLNAASSLRFPVAFIGKERRVDIEGEAYFEVARNKKMPFIAKTNGGEVQVLGTHFNVMAYQEENSVKTTLLEGSVKFVSSDRVSLLRPGQQAKLTRDGQVMVNEVDVDQAVAWKNGLFVFNNDDVATVMRQLSRWYDVEIVYQTKNLKQFFVGEVPRSSRLSDVLKVLELTSDIRFEIDGKKVIVT